MGMIVADTDTIRRLQKIERRLQDIQREIKYLKQSFQQSTVKMKGRLKGLRVDEKEFQRAEKSLFESE